MLKKEPWNFLLAGIAAGTVTGLLGAGGGMVLVPLLGMLTDLSDTEVFSASLGIILPICIAAILSAGSTSWREALVWLPGSAIGGYLAGKWGKRIPSTWLHRALGALILYGGIRFLC